MMNTTTSTECCATCQHCYKIELLDYSRSGCKHSDPDGFVCMVFADEGTASWMVGLDKQHGFCEGYEKRKKSSWETCSSCEHYIGGGDWNLCCDLKYDLCYKHTPACENYERRWSRT